MPQRLPKYTHVISSEKNKNLRGPLSYQSTVLNVLKVDEWGKWVKIHNTPVSVDEFNSQIKRLENEFPAKTFTVYETTEVDSLLSKSIEPQKNQLKELAGKISEIVTTIDKTKSECKTFTVDEIQKIVNALSGSSESEVASVFGKIVDERVSAARQEDLNTIARLQETMAAFETRLKQLETSS
jgi:hypothetical protein